jgi:hypothetical protein
MAPVSIIYGPQNCGAVAQTLLAKGRLQDDRRLFRDFDGFWLQSDWSTTNAERVGTPKLTRLRPKLSSEIALPSAARRAATTANIGLGNVFKTRQTIMIGTRARPPASAKEPLQKPAAVIVV